MANTLNSNKRNSISVCMATYNGEKYIKEQMDSILKQLSPNDEVIVSDDGSTDDTLVILESYHDPRIVIYQNNMHNYTRNFENAINKSSGDIIFLADQDDVWLENKVSLVLKTFEETNADLIVTNVSITDGNLNVVDESHFKSSHVEKGFLKNWLGTRYIGSAMAFKRKILDKVLPIPGKSKYIAHDYWIACICEKYYKTELIEQPLMLYRRHGDNASTGVGKSDKSFFFKCYKRFYTLHYILQRGKV